MAERAALAAHIFAGAFSGGVKDVMPVKAQLEVHDLGHETTEQVWNVPVIHSPAEEWPRIDADLLFANPRCTGFSCVTAGCDSTSHGPRAKQCRDIHDVMNYGLGHYPIVVWESVQQAYSVGKPLLDELAHAAVTRGYRVAYVFVNAHTFGNCQDRRRIFCVYYRRGLRFNVAPPVVSPYYPVLWDAVSHLRDRPVRDFWYSDVDYDHDSHMRLNPPEIAALPHLATGWDQNRLVEYGWHLCPPEWQRKWDERLSDMPFSMHSITRTAWLRPCPTLTNSCGRFIHPTLHRPFTIGELATIMGWSGRVPIGPKPFCQIAKGVVPAVAAWIAEQCRMCLDDEWGGDDYESSFNPQTGMFEGRDTHNEPVKEFDLTRYHGHQFDMDRFPKEAQECVMWNVDPKTGKLLKPWKNLPGRRA